ncbi:hypothetical protein BD779DRAFT_1528118 [Infundibulicybe gibba]|nr:hypothetical protein BD779DRAFT_1528118 [Infundibulicybe gibba]
MASPMMILNETGIGRFSGTNDLQGFDFNPKHFILDIIKHIGAFTIRIALLLKNGLWHLFEGQPQWPVPAFYAAHRFREPSARNDDVPQADGSDKRCLFHVRSVAQHPHSTYLLALSLFFGPIVVLLPLLILHELLVSMLFNSTLILFAGPVDTRYENLRRTFQGTRESIFASVENAASTFNRWTTECIPLLLFRILAGAIGVYVLLELWKDI